MRVDVLTIFPEMFTTVMCTSMLKIAQQRELLEFHAHDLREWTHDNHRTTDDTPYGGGAGQVMTPAPIFEALDDITPMSESRGEVIFFAPIGEPFTQRTAQELSTCDRLIMVCGRYEGFDERVYSLADRIVSIGDYVLTGGEIPAMAVIDATTRLIPGVLGDEMSPVDESFTEGLLEYPQYTRPACYRGLSVPDVLLSGHHANIEAWRRRESVIRTARRRPDLLGSAILDDDERMLVDQILSDRAETLESAGQKEEGSER